MLLLVFIWGLSPVLVKPALTYLAPLPFSAVRFVFAGCLLLLGLRLAGEDVRVQRGDLLRLIAVGLVGVTCYQIVYLRALHTNTATNVSLIGAASPGVIVAFSALSGRERPGRATWFGIGLALAGLAFVTGGRGDGLQVSLANLGPDLLALLSAFVWAGSTFLAQPLFAHNSPRKVTALNIAVGAVPLLALSWRDLAAIDWTGFSLQVWVALLYSSLISIAFGYNIYYLAVRGLGARSTVYLNLPPVTTIIMAYLLLGERMTPWQIVGAVVVLLGIYLARSSYGAPAPRRQTPATKGQAVAQAEEPL